MIATVVASVVPCVEVVGLLAIVVVCDVDGVFGAVEVVVATDGAVVVAAAIAVVVEPVVGCVVPV